MKAAILALALIASPALAQQSGQHQFDIRQETDFLAEITEQCMEGEKNGLDADEIKQACVDVVETTKLIRANGWCYRTATKEWIQVGEKACN